MSRAKKRFNINPNTELTEKFFFTIPYINGISEKFKEFQKNMILNYSSVS